MKFWEAMKALEEGKMVRAECFDPDQALDNWHGEVGYKEGRGSCNIFSVFNEEWELYEEAERTFSFMEVVQGLKEGKRFKRKAWDKNVTSYGEHPLTMHDSGYIGFASGSRMYKFCLEDFEATDWIECP